VLNNGFSYLDRQGHHIASVDTVQACTGLAKGGATEFNTCLHDQGIHLLNLYQSAGQFWLFQGIETTIFVIVGLALLALAIWWVRTRLS
jgi:hypothetical protein